MITTEYGPDNLRKALDLAEKARERFHPNAHPRSYAAKRLRERAILALGDEPGGIWDLANNHRLRANLAGRRSLRDHREVRIAEETAWMLATLSDFLAETPRGSDLDREAQRAEWMGSGRGLSDALATATDLGRVGWLGTEGTRLVATAARRAGLDVTPRTPHAHGALRDAS